MGIKFIKFAKIASLLVLFNLSFLALVPAVAGAQNQAPVISSDQRCANFMSQFGLSSGANVVASSSLPYFCSASGLVLAVFYWAMGLVGVVTAVFLIIGGFFYVTSAGNEEQSEKGKKIIINSVIGLVVVILATVIVRIISNLLLHGS
ncbi:MAG: pilin [Candidatus Doudnabacteria bacterium]|nr:pilin [Candidatus Doudnabacteria bacterium]